MTGTRRSLRARLVVWLVAVAGLAVLLAGAITLSLVRLIPERNLELQLAGQVELLRTVERRPLRQCTALMGLRASQTEVYLVDGDGTPRRPRALGCQRLVGLRPVAPAPAVDLRDPLAEGRTATGTSQGLAWAVAPLETPRGSFVGVLLVHEVNRLGLSLLPAIGPRLLLATAVAVAVFGATMIANLGSGAPYLVCWLLDIGFADDPVRAARATYEYGNTFLLIGGLLNYLNMLDAFDIAAGRKP